MQYVTCNINKSIKIALVFVLCVTCYMLPVTCVSAQQVEFSLDPPIVQARIKPGKSIIIAYTIVNNGDPTNMQFILRPFTPIGQLGSLTISPQLEGPVQFNLENADIVLEKPFFFPTREKKQAVLRIHVPPGIPDGDYYYLAMAESVPAFSAGGQSVGAVSASIGSPLLISITDSGITEIKATIAEFSFIPDYTFTIGNNTVSIVDNAKELPLVCSIRNMGKNLIQPQGKIIDKNGGEERKYSIIPQNILSNSQRIVKTFSNEGTLPAESSVVLTHLTVGVHRVVAEISFGDNTNIQYKALTFIALPIRLLTILLITLIIAVFILTVRFRKRNR